LLTHGYFLNVSRIVWLASLLCSRVFLGQSEIFDRYSEDPTVFSMPTARFSNPFRRDATDEEDSNTTEESGDNSPEESAASPSESKKSFFPQRIEISYLAGTRNGIAFMTNVTNLAILLAPHYRSERIFPMIDLRGHVQNDSTCAANVGLVGRLVPKENTRFPVLGMNAYLDYRHGGLGNYCQAGLGFEALCTRWDFRANFYAPFGRKKNTESFFYDGYTGGYFIADTTEESSSYGMNGEVGYLACDFDPFFVYAAAGPYVIARGCTDSLVGALGRLRTQYGDWAALEVSWSYDRVYLSVLQVEAFITIPLYSLYGKTEKRLRCGLTDRQIYQPVIRFDLIPLGRTRSWTLNFPQ
jgi:hypothetical protein